MMEPDRVGVSTAAFYPGYLTEDALAAIGQLGFRVVEVFLQAESEYNPRFGALLDKRRRELGLRIHSLHLHATSFDLWTPYSRKAAEVRERFQRLLEVAAMVDARALTWHGLRYGLDDARLVSAFVESAAWAGEEAAACGVALCLENVSWCYLRSPEEVRAVRDAGVQVSFTFDAFQACESGVDPVGMVEAMGAELVTVHLSDYRADGPRHLAPGEGDVDWVRLMRALQDVGYGGPLILETARMRDGNVLLEARAFVRRAWERAARDAA